mgnify:FL=1
MEKKSRGPSRHKNHLNNRSKVLVQITHAKSQKYRADAALNVQTGVDSGDHNEASGWLLLSMLGLTIVCASLGRKRIAK